MQQIFSCSHSKSGNYGSHQSPGVSCIVFYFSIQMQKQNQSVLPHWQWLAGNYFENKQIIPYFLTTSTFYFKCFYVCNKLLQVILIPGLIVRLRWQALSVRSFQPETFKSLLLIKEFAASDQELFNVTAKWTQFYSSHETHTVSTFTFQ